MLRFTLRSLRARKRRLLATGSAVVVGVAFFTGSLVLGDMVTRGFTDLFIEANAGIDAAVRSTVVVGKGDGATRGLIDASVADDIVAVNGVRSVAPRIEVEGRIVSRGGDPIDSGGSPTIVANWIEDDGLNPYQLSDGRPPTAPGEVVIDQRSARVGGLSTGDETTVRIPEPVPVTVVGLVEFGSADSAGTATYAAFTADHAAQVLVPEPGTASDIVVAAEAGVSQAELVDRIEQVLPSDAEALTGEELTAAMIKDIPEDFRGFVETVITAFAAIALVVGMVSIYNTFSIVVAQRTRESALLRALGASRLQIVLAVSLEAIVVGFLASLAGVAVGIGLAFGLRGLMEAIGRSVPPASLALTGATFLASMLVGVLVSLAASLIPAVRASRTAPLAALREEAVDRSDVSTSRAVVGWVMLAVGVALLVVGALAESIVFAGIGGVAAFAGVLVLGPVIVPPAVSAYGAVQARFGLSGELARRNSVRNPKRTAATSAPLVIGVAIVVLFATIASSFNESISASVGSEFTSDLVIVGEGTGGLSRELGPALADLPEVAVVSEAGVAPVSVGGTDMLATSIEPETIEAVVDIGVAEGALNEIRSDGIAVSVAFAEENGFTLGSGVEVRFPDGTIQQMDVRAIYTEANLGSPVMLPMDTFLEHSPVPTGSNMQIVLADGVSETDGQEAAQRVAHEYGAPDVLTNAQFVDTVAGEVNQFLTVVYALLILAIVIALMGISNTLSLSIHERTRELGLLRAVGQTRPQVRAMVRGEAVTLSLLGTATGLSLGLLLSWAFIHALSNEGLTTFVIPIPTLLAIVILGIGAGIASSVHPANRASRLNVLEAIATE